MADLIGKTLSQEIAVIASGPPAATETPLDDVPGPSSSSSSGSSTSLALVEREYVIQPNTIIELVDLYVPPVRSEFRIPIFQAPDEVLGNNSGAQSIRGRRRGRPPLGTRPSGVTTRKPYRRRPRQESPPPLPPVPNYLSHVINPLENEIYPKVIVQPARLPFVIPKNLNEDPPAPPPPLPPAPPVVQPQPGDTPKDTAQLRENLKLFGPNVTVAQVTSHGQSRFLAIHKKPNGEQRKILFSASQLQAFVASRGSNQVAGGSWSKPSASSISRLRPGPAPRRLSEPPVAAPAVQPPRIIVEPPPNFRLPTMAALRAAAQQNARQAAARGGPAAGSSAGSSAGSLAGSSMGPSISPSAGPSLCSRVGITVGMGGKPLASPSPLIVKVSAGVWAKAKADQQEQAASKESTTKETTPAPAPAPQAPAPAQIQVPTPPQTMPPPPRPLALELSNKRVPSILTRKSQLRLLHQRAKMAAEKEVEDAKKLRQSLQDTQKHDKENKPLKIFNHKP